ncbi:MAG: peptide-methionine (R)-S-oxide reductase MsrB [Methanomassiliicoccales archaeon]
MKYEVERSESEWRNVLTKEQFRVLRKGGTEYPFTGRLLKEKRKGVYRCAGCGNPIFPSGTKFDSGTGWPSFSETLTPDRVELRSDRSLGTERTEVLCARCGGHLGHVFDDGPPPTGKRYCMNSVALEFQPE